MKDKPKKAAQQAADKPAANGGAKARPKATVVLSSTTGNPFAGIGEALTQLSLGVPTLDSLADIDNVGEGIEAKKAARNKIVEGIANAIKFIVGLFRRLNACEDADEREFLKEEVQESETNARAYLAKCLDLKGRLRAIAARTYIIEAMTASSPDEANMMLNDLVNQGLLTSRGSGPCVTVGYLNYHLGDFGLNPDDVRQITAVLDQFSRAAKIHEKERRQKLSHDLASASQISLEEALSGQTGRCLLHVPPEAFVPKGETETKWRGGGDVLFDFQEKVIRPVRASGSVERLVSDLSERDAKITRASLTWEHPAMQSLTKDFQRKLGINWDIANDMARDFLTVWHLVKRGIGHAYAMTEQAEELAKMTAQAEISAIQFFGLNGTGSPVVEKPALLQLHGVLRLETENIYHPFLLARRVEENGKEAIEVVGVPTFLQGLLGETVGKRFSTDRKAHPLLSDLIYKIRGQTELAVATAPANNHEAETA